MKKILLSVFSSVLIVAVASAQCSTKNYIDQVHSTVTKTTVQYSTTNMSMDIFTPDGDNSTSRPLMILAHGGSFTSGSRTEAGIVTLCENFAKRGYVTASISYRLASSPIDMVNTSTAYPVVVKAISDAKAAVRYFTKDAATTNTYKINPNKIFLGGNSAGSVLAIQYAYIDDTMELAADLRSVIRNNGGIEGNSGNDGYSSQVHGILNLAGGILDTNWIADNTEQPIASFHGTADATVPFNCGGVLNGLSQVTLCGTGTMQPRYEGLGIASVTKIYVGADHVPWSSDAAMLDEVDSIAAKFFATQVCGSSSVGIDEKVASSNISLYPNPAKDVINFEFSGEGKVDGIRLIDAVGREVYSANPINNKSVINTANFQTGIYFAEVTLNGNQRLVNRVQIVK
jgi:poly(3-hydroxybutyrate) depolymerase